MELTGTKSVLRTWQRGDAPALAKYADNRKVWRNLGHGFAHPYTLETAEAWVADRLADQGPVRRFAIDIDGEAAGGVGIHPLSDVEARTAAIGYWLGEPFWGRGIMTEAVSLLVRYAFATFPVHRLQAGVYAWNPPSARVLEKNGFVLEGRLRDYVFHDGLYVDALLFGLLRQDFEAANP